MLTFIYGLKTLLKNLRYWVPIPYNPFTTNPERCALKPSAQLALEAYPSWVRQFRLVSCLASLGHVPGIVSTVSKKFGVMFTVQVCLDILVWGKRC